MATPTTTEAQRKSTLQQNKKQDKSEGRSNDKEAKEPGEKNGKNPNSAGNKKQQGQKQPPQPLGIPLENNKIDSLTFIFWLLLLCVSIIVDILDALPLISDAYDWILDLMYWPVAMLFVSMFQGLKKGVMLRSSVVETLGAIGNAFPIVDLLPFAITATLLVLLDMKYNIFAVKKYIEKPGVKTVTSKTKQ